MEFDKVIENRKSSREFQKIRKPSWKKALVAIDSSLQGPFAGNFNSLKFLIVEEKDKKKQISKYSEQPWISDSSLLIIVCSDEMHLEKMYGTERGKIYARQQAGSAIQTILLKLTDLGVDSCWVGSYTEELIKTLLKIPEDIRVEAIIPIGYAKDKNKKAKPKKKDIESCLFWENWENKRRHSLFEESMDEPHYY